MSFYRMYRGWQDNPVFRAEPYTEREAWEWLIGNACYKPHIIRVAGRVLELRRGQLSYSLRYMGARWQWSEPKVRRYIYRLKTDAMIDAAIDARQMLITVCNYDRYQGGDDDGDATSDATSDASLTQDRRKSDANKKEGKEGIESKNDVVTASANGRAPSSTFDPLIAPAIDLIAIFDDCRATVWGSNQRRPYPRQTDTAIAMQWVQAGMAPRLLEATILPVMRDMFAKAQAPPDMLKYFDRPVANALATASQPMPKGSTNGRHKPEQPSFDEIKRKILVHHGLAEPGPAGHVAAGIPDHDPES